MRSYGTARYDARFKKWLIQTEPHVALRLKRVFAKIDARQHGVLSLSATTENSRDLEWFMERYPMVVEPADVLTRLANEHKEAETVLQQLLSGNHPLISSSELKLPPRDYQTVAARIWRTVFGYLLADDVGLGKAQPLDAKVLTPSGWVQMGNLKVGDEVVDPDGGKGLVEAIYPQGVRPVFSVKASDGSSTRCCDEHLWLVQTASDRMRQGQRVLALKEFKHKLHRVHRNRVWKTSNIFLPQIDTPISFTKAGELPLHPYCLGLLLGDEGLTTFVKITSAFVR